MGVARHCKRFTKVRTKRGVEYRCSKYKRGAGTPVTPTGVCRHPISTRVIGRKTGRCAGYTKKRRTKRKPKRALRRTKARRRKKKARKFYVGAKRTKAGRIRPWIKCEFGVSKTTGKCLKRRRKRRSR